MKPFLSLLLLVPPAAPSMPPVHASPPSAMVTAHTNAAGRRRPSAATGASLAVGHGPARSRSVAPASPGDPAPLSPAATRKVEALLRDHLPCLGCHTLNGSGGKIGPDLSSVRTRRSPEYIAAMLADPLRVVSTAAMPRPLVPASTRELLVRYLASRAGNAAGAVPPPVATPSAPTTDGAALYAKWCAACHGTSGKGDGPNASSLPVKPSAHNDKAAMSRRPDDSLYDTIAGGGEIMNRSPRMPAFGGSLTPAQIRALVAHIRTLCSCQGPAWSRDDAKGP